MSPRHDDYSSSPDSDQGNPQNVPTPSGNPSQGSRPSSSLDDLAKADPPPYQISFQRIDPRQNQPFDRRQVAGEPLSPPAAPSPESTKVSPSPKRSRRVPDPISQSLGLLATMAVMLLVARFAVPTIVEEVRYAWHRGELRAEYETGTDGLKNVSLEALSDAYGMVTAVVGPSVVHIDVKRRQSLQEFAGNDHVVQSRLPSLSDQGSGIVVDAEGYILTNSHVISGGEDITVTLSDGRRKPAVIVGVDSLTDLAILKVHASDLIAITWGDSDACKVGSPVWAVGSPFGLDRTVTFGIISGKHRTVRSSTQWQDFMQSDVAVNPGNSGGPLVDARGTLVGVNTAIVGDTYQGVSFSVPSNTAKKIYERLRETGKVQRGWLGVSLASVSDDELVGDDLRLRGTLIEYLPDPNAPAAVAGIHAGDLVTHMDGTALRDTSHLMQMIGEAVPQQTIRLGIYRSGERLELEVTLGTRPEILGR